MFEPNASWSLPAHLFMVSEWSANCTQRDDPMSCVERAAEPGPAAATPKRAQRSRSRRTTPGPTSPTCCTSTTSAGATTSPTGTEPDCEDDAMTCAPEPQNAETPGIWNPLPYFDTVQAGRPARQHPDARPLLRRRRRAARCPRCRGSCRTARSASTRPRSISDRPGVRHQPDQRGHAGPGLEQHRDLPRLGRLGRLLRPRRAAHGRRRTATACACPGIVISPYAKQGYIDHQTLSFDAYVKFIEDDFLGGQRLDPATDGRPDPRPTCARTRPQLGDLTQRLRLHPDAAPAPDLAAHPPPGPAVGWGIPHPCPSPSCP